MSRRRHTILKVGLALMALGAAGLIAAGIADGFESTTYVSLALVVVAFILGFASLRSDAKAGTGDETG